MKSLVAQARMRQIWHGRPSKHLARRGQSLVEFAVVALVTYMLLAAILTFGHALFAAQQLQSTVDFAAREISRTPLPAETTLEEVLNGNANTDPELEGIRGEVFDEHYLVLNLETLHGSATLMELVSKLPRVNQQLFALMIFDRIGETRVLRYPGAVFTDIDNTDDPSDPPPSGWLISIPLVADRDTSGVETIDWIPVVEEVDSADEVNPFQLSSNPSRGLVTLRINYPFQAAAMSSFRPNPAGPFEPTIGNLNVAHDDGVAVVDKDGYSPAGSLVTRSLTNSDGTYAGTHGGTYGLGAQGALGQQVRPYRRVLSFQAVYRREIFR